MKPYLQYLNYVVRHKWFVFLAGLRTGAPIWQLILHDWSKFLPDEFIPYADYFYNNDLQSKENSEVFGIHGLAEAAPYYYYASDRFKLAWLLHQRRNKHHWQWWYLVQDNDPSFALPMPEQHAREMVADWAGAGRAITGEWGVAAWYQKNRDKIKLYPDTRALVEKIIIELWPPEDCICHCNMCGKSKDWFCYHCAYCAEAMTNESKAKALPVSQE